MVKLKSEFRKLNKELVVECSGEKIVLPADIQKKVDEYWMKLLASGRKLTRGEGYTITAIDESSDCLKITLALSDYAHYIYSRHIGLPPEYAFKNIHTSCLIETADNFLIFGVMGKQTSIAGTTQCIGGGLDNNDLEGGRFNLGNNIKNELLEEVNVDAEDEKMAEPLKMEFINFSGTLNSIAAIFVLKLKIDCAEFQKRYSRFEKDLAENGSLPEFGEIIYLKKTREKIEKFLKTDERPDHYLRALLLQVVGD
jgi:hypothetical protein